MNCDEMKALLPEYVEGALSGDRRRQAEAHLSGCPSCTGALTEAGKVDTFLRGALPVPERAPEAWAKQEARVLQAAARQAGGSISGRRRIPAYLWLGVAAVLLVAVGVYFVLSSPTPAERNRAVAGEPPPPAKAEKREFSSSPREQAAEPPISSPANDPDPRSFTFPRETAPDDPAPSPRRDPAPVLPQETAVSVLLPGDADHLDRLTDENIEVGLADSPSDRVMGLIKAADGRLSELRAAIGAKRETMAEDLAAAYTLICRQGISAVLADRTEDPQDLATARVVAKTYAGWKVDTLAKLEPDARGSLKTAIHEALLATRELAGQ